MNYTANDIAAFLGKYEKHFAYVIVAHTHHRNYVGGRQGRTYNPIRRRSYLIERTNYECRYALNCFYKLLYPGATNKPFRQPLVYRPLTLVTIEGADPTTDPAQTVHCNITLGNLPKHLNTNDIQHLFTQAWHHKAKLSQDIKVIPYQIGQANNWTGYSLKEAQQAPFKAVNTDGIWSVDNCWIPHTALAED